jgi:hypothetical protein
MSNVDAVSKHRQEDEQEHRHSSFIGDRDSHLYDARRYLFDVRRKKPLLKLVFQKKPPALAGRVLTILQLSRESPKPALPTRSFHPPLSGYALVYGHAGALS